MSFEDMMDTNITIIGKNGKRYEDVKANVQKDKIILMRSDIPVKTGDTIERTLPNNIKERYEVINPVFHNKLSNIPAHYQIDVRRKPDAGRFL